MFGTLPLYCIWGFPLRTALWFPARDQGQRVETCCAKKRRKINIQFKLLLFAYKVWEKKIAKMITFDFILHKINQWQETNWIFLTYTIFNIIDPQANCITRLMYAVLYMRRSSNIGGWTQIRWSFVVIPLCSVWCLQYGWGLGALEYLFFPSKTPRPNSEDSWRHKGPRDKLY